MFSIEINSDEMYFQGLRDRLLVWFSHCEVLMRQIEDDALATTTQTLQKLNRLQEELDDLNSLRTEIFQLGQTLAQQGTTDIKQDLDEYLQVENATMFKLAQLRMSFTQQPEARSTPALNGDFQSITWFKA